MINMSTLPIWLLLYPLLWATWWQEGELQLGGWPAGQPQQNHWTQSSPSHTSLCVPSLALLTSWESSLGLLSAKHKTHRCKIWSEFISFKKSFRLKTMQSKQFHCEKQQKGSWKNESKGVFSLVFLTNARRCHPQKCFWPWSITLLARTMCDKNVSPTNTHSGLRCKKFCQN